MARTSLLQAVQDAVASVADERGVGRSTRREFLVKAGAAGVGLTAVGQLARPARAAAGDPTVAIVGAGLAGLTCAYRFSQTKQGRNAVVEIYDANPSRLGGRCWSGRAGAPDNPFDAQVFEHGGELIDQSHTAIRQLAQSLGLDLDNLLAAEVNGTEIWALRRRPVHLRGGDRRHEADLAAAAPGRERGELPDDCSTPRRHAGASWTACRSSTGSSATCRAGVARGSGQLLEVAYTIEYGGEASEQSSLNMLYLLAYIGQGQMRILGPSNEKYHVRGGNDQITDRLAAALAGRAAFSLDPRSSRSHARPRTARADVPHGPRVRDVHRGPGRDDDPVLDPAHAGLLEAGFSAAQGAGDPRARRSARTPSSTSSSRDRIWAPRARTARRSPTAATRTRGR